MKKLPHIHFLGWNIQHMLLAIAGTFIFALGVNLFAVPAGLYNGGFLGIGQLLRTLFVSVFGWNFGSVDIAGVIYYFCNIPLFILAYTKLGKAFAFRTLICMTMLTVFLTVIPNPPELLVEEQLAASLIGGILAGAGIGVTLYAGGSTGGNDILGIYFTKKYKEFSVGKLALLINISVYVICAFVFDLQTVIYSIIYVTFSAMITDRVHQQNICSQVFIFTKKDPMPIVHYVTANMVRGTTYWEGTGGYTGEKTNIIYAVTSKYELHELHKFLKEYDIHAFVVKQNGIAIDGKFEKKLE